MTSQWVERTWIRAGGYERFRGEWVKVIETSMKLKVTPEDPLPSGFPEPLTPPPPSREIFQQAFHHGGVDFFWNNPM